MLKNTFPGIFDQGFLPVCQVTYSAILQFLQDPHYFNLTKKVVSTLWLEIFSLLILVCLSTVVGGEKLTSREDQIGLLFFYV